MRDKIDRLNFFTTIYKHCEQGRVEIRCLPSKKRDYFKVEEAYRAEFDTTENVFFGVATRDGNGGGKANIEEIPAVWCDIDFKATPKDRRARLELTRLLLLGFKLFLTVSAS